jgi:hypothetical protein
MLYRTSSGSAAAENSLLSSLDFLNFPRLLRLILKLRQVFKPRVLHREALVRMNGQRTYPLVMTYGVSQLSEHRARELNFSMSASLLAYQAAFVSCSILFTL